MQPKLKHSSKKTHSCGYYRSDSRNKDKDDMKDTIFIRLTAFKRAEILYKRFFSSRMYP